MREWFIVQFFVGKDFREMHIYAHDKEQAKEITRLQVRCLGKTANIRFTNVRKEGEPDPQWHNS